VTEPVTRDDVEAAQRRLDGRVRRTPVLVTSPGDLGLDLEVRLKLEVLQHTGSFKARGALHLLLAREVPAGGVVAASGGNFGLAIAWAAQQLGHPAHVFVPDSSPPAKVDRLRTHGAEVHVVPGTYQQALDASREHLERHGGLAAHAYDQPEVVAGQGTAAAELAAQAPDLDTVLVAVGGGGLLGGVAAWYGDRMRVVAVETEGTPTLHRALAEGRPVDVAPEGLCVSSLGATRIGDLGFAAARRWVDASLLVADVAVREAQYRLWDACRLAAEPGGVTALAALTSGAYEPEPGERVGVLVCGANVDPAEVVRP
jgi:threonine dehydratase